MILAIDGYEANVSQRVGIGSYAYEIIKGIYSLSSQATETRIYLPSQPLKDLPKEKFGWKYYVRRPKKFWTFLGLPLALQQKPRADVVFSPTHYVPRFTTIPRVMAIMDLSYLHYPELFKPKDLHQLVNWTKFSVNHTQAILTISEFSKNAILERYQVDADKVHVTYPGFHMKEEAFVDIATVYGVHNPYILSVGTIQPRKNFVRLVEAFSLLKHQEKYQEYQLVIVGKKGWLFEETLKSPQRFGVAESVKFLDFVPNEHLPTLYELAECFVLPSLYEGFGLPVLEAMNYGTIVVVSNSSSLPEIAGNAGIFVDPESTEHIVSGIIQALSEKGTKKGDERIAKGLEHIKKFSWQTAAQQTLTVLEKVGKGAL